MSGLRTREAVCLMDGDLAPDQSKCDSGPEPELSQECHVEHCEEEEIERMALESGALVGEKGAVRVMDDEGFVAINPTAVPTEREVHSSADGERVYRSLFRKLAAQP